MAWKVIIRSSAPLLVTLLCCIAHVLAAGCAYTGIYYAEGEPRCATPTPQSPVQHRVLLIGDAGKLESSRRVLAILESRASQYPDKTVTVFLGDNIYDRGMPPESAPRDYKAEATIQAQLDVLSRSRTRGLFVTGNHDWGLNLWRLTFPFLFHDDGYERVMAQSTYIDSRSSGWKTQASAALVPKPDVEFPVYQDTIHPHVVLIDTQRLLFRTEQRDLEPQILDGGRVATMGTGSPILVLAGHHPINTYGEHAGYVVWNPILAPIQFIAWLPRWLGVSNQDLKNSQHEKMTQFLDELMKNSGALIYASGHDHSLQVLKKVDDSYYALVCGSGSKKDDGVGRGSDTLFAYAHLGIMEIDHLENDGVVLRVFIPDKTPGTAKCIYSRWLRLPPRVHVPSVSSMRSISWRRSASTSRATSSSSISRRSSLLSASRSTYTSWERFGRRIQ